MVVVSSDQAQLPCVSNGGSPQFTAHVAGSSHGGHATDRRHWGSADGPDSSHSVPVAVRFKQLTGSAEQKIANSHPVELRERLDALAWEIVLRPHSPHDTAGPGTVLSWENRTVVLRDRT